MLRSRYQPKVSSLPHCSCRVIHVFLYASPRHFRGVFFGVNCDGGGMFLIAICRGLIQSSRFYSKHKAGDVRRVMAHSRDHNSQETG